MIPNIVHFNYGLIEQEDDFLFVYYVAVLSCKLIISFLGLLHVMCSEGREYVKEGPKCVIICAINLKLFYADKKQKIHLF